jgi:uncharacterized protein
MKSVATILFVLALAAAAAGWAYLRQFERSRVFRPRPDIESTPAQFQLRFQDVQFVSEDGTSLHGWWIPAKTAWGTVVYCHGNSGNVGTFAHYAPEFVRRGFNLFLWDYRGYGRSDGHPSEEGIAADARAAYDVAAELSPSLPIVVYGLSLGGAVASRLATERPAAGLVVEAGFVSLEDMARRQYPRFPMHRLMSMSFDSAASVAALEGMPKLIGHSIHDEVVPFQSARLLHGAAAAPATFAILEGGHNDSSWFRPGAAGNAELEAFLKRYKP